MFLNLFKKKNKKIDSYAPSPFDSRYYMDTNKYAERKDDIYEFARIYPNNESFCDSECFLSFSYDLICKLAENNNLCYYVEYDENLPEHKEVIAYLQKNFENGDVYSLIYSARLPILAIRQSKPTVEIMAKAGKDGFSYASGVQAYIYKDTSNFDKHIVNNAVELLGAEKQYAINISVDDHTCFMYLKYDKAHISFDEIVKAAEDTAQKYGKYMEIIK